MCDSVSVTENLCLGVSAFEAFGYGYFTRAWVHDNVSGDSTGVLDEPSSLFGVGRAAISHVRVNSNRKFTYRLGDNSGICGFSPIWPPDSAYAEDIVVEYNTIYDRREIDYSDDEAWYNGIEGIACSFNLWGENVSVIRDCVFRNNTTSQPIREYFIYHSPVGSNVTISGGASHSVLIENLLIEAANDGGIWADMASGAVTMRNIVLRDVDRYGIRFHDSENGTFPGNHVFENILIEDSDEYCMELPYPYIVSVQQAFSATCARRSIEARNISFIGCNYTIANKLSETEFLNCLETDFHYQIRQHPIYADSPVSFRYCNTETLQPGTGNISQPPRFDPERGIPFLAPDSPCIDAGHPDAAYNDIEDPDAPGFALWPSQGGLRNDIGCTGGPYANDSMFVSVVPATPTTLPTSPTLGDAYPNPYNPVTTIPFVILQPTHLRLAVYNLRGQQIATLADDAFLPGEHRVTFDGSSLASGVYLIHLNGEDVSRTRKVLLLK